MQQRLFYFFILNIIICLHLSADRPKICLNMIIKDETPVIRRCLDSVKSIIDYWVIVDTGSKDGTQEMVRNHMKDFPGELHERPWVDFSHNRNEALNLAKNKGDYVLFIDADEVLCYEEEFHLPVLDKDFYYIETQFGGTKYKRVELINNHLDWKWVGVLHEALEIPPRAHGAVLENVINIPRPEGNRSQDPQKYHKDAAVFEKALIEEPNNTRYMFYLAQSYRDANEPEKALEAYEKRFSIKVWDQELFCSLLEIAKLKEKLKKSPEEIIESYQAAYQFRPTRIEPLYHLALYYRNNANFEEAYKISRQGLAIKESNDLLFVQKWMHDYGMLLEYSIAAYWTNHYPEALIASQLLLSQPDLPDNVKQCVNNNLVWINSKLGESIYTDKK